MVEMRGGITGVGNNGPVNAPLCVSVSKEAFMGGWAPRLQQVISTVPAAGRGAGREDNSSSLSSAPGAGRRDWTRLDTPP